MIVRYALKCGTCEKPHTVRIGMCHDAMQIHKFPYRKCGEEIIVRMDFDHTRFAWKVECVENCEAINIERNTIARLSNFNKPSLDPSSDNWLGHCFDREVRSELGPGRAQTHRR